MAEISSITFSGYKSLGEVTLSPLSRINVLTGRNNIGKSAVLQLLWALSTGDQVAQDLAEGPQKREPALPREGFRESVTPYVAITTLTAQDELEDGLQSALRQEGLKAAQHKDAYDRIRNSGVFSSLTWVFQQDNRGGLRLHQTTSQGLTDVSPWIKMQEDRLMLNWKPAIDFVNQKLSVSFIKYMHSQPGRFQPAPDGLPKNPQAAPHLIRPHWSALHAFLSRHRFFLRTKGKRPTTKRRYTLPA